jgi:hypothetical protein
LAEGLEIISATQSALKREADSAGGAVDAKYTTVAAGQVSPPERPIPRWSKKTTSKRLRIDSSNTLV